MSKCWRAFFISSDFAKMNVFHISAAKICKIPWSPIRSVRCAFEYISSNWCRFCFNNAGKRIENTRIENWAMRSYWLSFKLWQRTTCYICLAFMYHETYHSLHRIIRARTSESTFPLIIVSTTRYVKTYNITWVMIYKKTSIFLLIYLHFSSIFDTSYKTGFNFHSDNSC